MWSHWCGSFIQSKRKEKREKERKEEKEDVSGGGTK